MRRLFAFAVFLLAVAGEGGYAQTAPVAPSGGQPVILDHVVAVINGDVLLESDVSEEVHFGALELSQAGVSQNPQRSAMRRLINRSLILQQMKEQQQFNINVSDADVQKSLDDLRAHLPQCAKYDCKTEEGWKAFLAANDLTEGEVNAHWKQRMVILRFIDLRFKTGIRISHESIEDYYTKSVVPAFEQQHRPPPPLKDVSGRIQEVLLQQQVSGLLQDWMKSLRAEGSVQILDPAYSTVVGSAAGANGNATEDEED